MLSKKSEAQVKAFKEKNWQLCYDLSSEAIRLNPRKKEYLGNRAASGLKLKAKRYLRQAAEALEWVVAKGSLAQELGREAEVLGANADDEHQRELAIVAFLGRVPFVRATIFLYKLCSCE